jgi:Trehalose-phosphatase
VQARDLLQHLWTGPISNAPVDIVQGSKSVEVRPVGISKVSTHATNAYLHMYCWQVQECPGQAAADHFVY